MNVEILCFGLTADIVGSHGITLTTDDATTAKSLIDHLSRSYPSLATHKLLVAVNEEYADADTILKDGDELAIFTAVSGG